MPDESARPSTHSPLPPGLPVTLEMVNITVERLAVAVERIAGTEEAREDRHERRMRELDEKAAALAKIGRDLSDGYGKLFQAKALAWVLPHPARLVALALGALIGSYLATWIWLMVHGHPLVAALANR